VKELSEKSLKGFFHVFFCISMFTRNIYYCYPAWNVFDAAFVQQQLNTVFFMLIVDDLAYLSW